MKNWYKKAQEEAWKKYVSTYGDAKIFHVDGNYVRNNIEVEFTLGGHGFRYKFIPKDEIWIEKLENKADMDSNLIHEMIERSLMKDYGTPYEEAHNYAAQKEQKVREVNVEKEK